LQLVDLIRSERPKGRSDFVGLLEALPIS